MRAGIEVLRSQTSTYLFTSVSVHFSFPSYFAKGESSVSNATSFM